MSGWTALAAAAGLIAATPLFAAVANGSSAEHRAQTSDEHARLFDGESLEGWTTRGGRYDGSAVWSVEDGMLTGRVDENGAGGLLYTTRSYTCFDLTLECRMDYPYDSGVFVRMLPPDSDLRGLQATLDHRPGGEIAAIYADGFLFHNTGAEEYFAKDEWNRVRVRVTGFDPRVQVWINGRPVTDYRLPAGTPGFASRGLIGLQVHGADAEAASRNVQFRDISIRELDVFTDIEFDGAEGAQKKNAGALHHGLGGASDGSPSAKSGPVSAPAKLELDSIGLETLTGVARDAGWRDLLANGLEGWEAVGSEGGYAVADGVLSIPASGSGHLVTIDDFTDFRLRLDFKIAEMANSGLFLRGARAGGDPAYSGCEIQILDDFNWEERTDSKLAAYQFTGGLYAAVPPGPDKEYREPGAWNRYEVLVRGSRMAAALNGRLLFDVDTLELDVQPPFAERAASGFIGLQRYGADSVVGDWSVEVRNVFVQSLAPLDEGDDDPQAEGER